MKLFALGAVVGASSLVLTGVLPCPIELVSSAFGGGSTCCAPGACDAAPSGLYLEARNATVWGGACHIGSQAVSQGAHAVQGWAFDAGSEGGVDLAGVRVAVAVEGTANLQGDEVFRTGEVADRRSVVWVDAPNAEARDAAVAHVRRAARLGAVLDVVEADVSVTRDGDAFAIVVPGVLDLAGDAIPDRSCCTMPESRWYAPLAAAAEGSIVGNPSRCRFEGASASGGALAGWAFEGENSAFIASFGA